MIARDLMTTDLITVSWSPAFPWATLLTQIEVDPSDPVFRNRRSR